MGDKDLIEQRMQKLIAMTAGFCDAYVDEEYKQLCEKLIRKMSRKRNVPFLSGRMEIWAAAIIHALSSINFLFDTSKEGSQKVKMYLYRCHVLGFRGLTTDT